MNEFKIGDVVTLKSGSIDLTITHVNNSGYVTVTWFSTTESSFKFEQNIPFSALKKVS